MLSADIRKKFIEYFKSKGHTHLPSSPVVPHDDPTLLFTNAGMNQFKDIFLGRTKMDYTRAVTSQKCIRVGGKHNDLDNVGHTSRHMTFFEMLGNFSFGDYFKKEAIQFAFEVATEVFEFELDRLWISVYEDDDEAYELWKAHVKEDRLVRMGAKDNFWMMGDVGPCGPCSELYYDRGPQYGDAKDPSDPAGENRFLEFWNLVFMQYSRAANGEQTPLPNQSIDTGAGLERIAALKLGVDTVFETDILQSIIRVIERSSGKKYEAGSELAPAFHVIADHIRSLSFAIADGVQPSNLDRGYVLRKILRRAVRYGKRLGFEQPFLADAVPTLIDTMGDDFPELKSSKERIGEILTTEEESFFRTLKRGGNILSTIIENAEQTKSRQISGEDAFKLKDTYGFPLEEILLIAKDGNLEVNIEQFELLEHKAKELSRKAHVSHKQEVETGLYEEFVAKHGTSEFVGYDATEAEASITGIICGGAFVDKLEAGQKGEIILDSTPFYAEKGGQVGDTGMLEHDSASFEVKDTKTPFTGVIVHRGIVKEGALIVGEPLTARVNHRRRARISAHHTATHLLHKALCDELGEHIRQSGSLVEENRLRFDFTHHKGVSADELRALEEAVNHKISHGCEVSWREIPYSEAQQDSSIKQFFGDKYGAEVRVVSVGDEGGSELCGGTHVTNLGDIGLFRITKESSIGAGVRRIEACVGAPAIAFMFEQEDLLHRVASKLETELPKLEVRVDSLLQEEALLKSELKELKREKIHALIGALADKSTMIDNVPYIFEQVDVDTKELAGLANLLMEKTQAGAVFLASEHAGRCGLVLKLREDLVKKGIKAGDLIKKAASHVKGSGGGKPDMAQAGGTDPSGIPQAIETIHDQFKC